MESVLLNQFFLFTVWRYLKNVYLLPPVTIQFKDYVQINIQDEMLGVDYMLTPDTESARTGRHRGSQSSQGG